jgi:tetratricopeptide (TPR) repeat protein
MGDSLGAIAAAERALELAERVGAARERVMAIGVETASLVDGPTPAPAAIARCEEILASGELGVETVAQVKRKLSMLYVMRGEIDEARRLIDEALETYEELGLPLPLGSALGQESAAVHWAGDDLAAAESDLRRAVELFSTMDEKSVLSTLTARLAEILIRREKDESEAEDLLRVSEEMAGKDDWVTHLAVKEARALLLSRRGEFNAAALLAREALVLADDTDDIESSAWQRVGLAEILARAGRSDEAELLLAEAIELFDAKGHVFGAEEARQTLQKVREPAANERAGSS